jgi:hypothetical protein
MTMSNVATHCHFVMGCTCETMIISNVVAHHHSNVFLQA